MWRDPRTGTILREGAIQNWPTPMEERFIHSLRARAATVRDSERQVEREVKLFEIARAALEAAKAAETNAPAAFTAEKSSA